MSGSAPTPTGRVTSDFALTGRKGVRYEVLAEIGSGGMATVQYGRLNGPHGFARNVAIKRLHPQFAKDPEFVKMFIDEARLSARVAHANIVATLDVIDGPGELSLVMDYVHGESLWDLLRLTNQYGTHIPVRVATALAAGVLYGLHAAHVACDEQGRPLDIVHRDVSPHNILVGSDGIARLIDFGVAKAVGRLRTTPSGEIKGKLIYMAPEQLRSAEIDRRADVYGAAAVLWETLTGSPIFDGPSESSIVHAVLLGEIEPPGQFRDDVPPALDACVLRGLARDPEQRYATAREMALELERNVGIASQSELADWLQELAGARLSERSRLIAAVQESARGEGTVRAGQVALDLGPNTKPMATPTSVPTSGSAFRRRELLEGRSVLRLAVAVAALLLLGVTFWYVRVMQHPRATAAPARQTPVATTAAAITAEPQTPPPPAAAEQDLPRGIAPPDPVLPEPAKLDPAPPPAATPLKKRARREPTTQPPAATQAPTTRTECTPWFYVDEAGIRRPKPGCL